MDKRTKKSKQPFSPLKKSTNHHYIPKFYINGFTNEKKELYVYNKKTDTVIERAFTPSAIFYEKDANTIEFEGQLNTELEEKYYGDLDEHFSTVIQRFRSISSAKELFVEENNIGISLFFTSIFWRLPATKSLAIALLEQANLTINRPNRRDSIKYLYEDKNYKKNPSFQKLAKAYLFFESTNKITDRPDTSVFHRLKDFPTPSILLGDYPMIYEKTPNCFDDLYSLNHIFPISATRIVTRTEKELKPFTIDAIIPINLSIIHQSSNYVVSPNYEFLDSMIKYYRLVSSIDGMLENEINKTFNFL